MNNINRTTAHYIYATKITRDKPLWANSAIYIPMYASLSLRIRSEVLYCMLLVKLARDRNCYNKYSYMETS